MSDSACHGSRPDYSIASRRHRIAIDGTKPHSHQLTNEPTKGSSWEEREKISKVAVFLSFVLRETERDREKMI